MDFTGIHLSLLIGPSVAVPAPPMLMEALQEVQVMTDENHSTFQITFQIGRSGPADLVDSALLLTPLLDAWSRVIVVVVLGAIPRVLMDGFITDREFTAGDAPGQTRVTITGADVSVRMNLTERSTEHPALDDYLTANQLILSYADLGLIPTVIPPPVIDPVLPIDRTPLQSGTDLEHLRAIARRYGYVFYVVPGPLPFTNTAYWGPPVRIGVPQSAISVNMGPSTNASGFTTHSNALGPTRVEGTVQDRLTGQDVPVQTFASLRPPLALLPSWLVNQHVRVTRFRESGLNAMQAMARAQGTTEQSMDSVSAEGELDAMRYGDLLRPRGLVGVRGAGFLQDGLWYVNRVTHRIRKERYVQNFSLSREGYGSTVPAVLP